MLSNKLKPICTGVFLVLEAVLYGFILTTGGQTLVTCEYLAIVLCFVFALLNFKKTTMLIVAGLAFTLGADYFLVVANPQQQLWGMVFFMGAQTMYAIFLQLRSRNRALLIGRIALIVLAEGIAWIVLGDKLDPLAAVSMYYYANLIMNLIVSFTMFRIEKLLSIGFVLFLLCDTVIGLQVACGGYLAIDPNSLLYRIIFMPFHLSWFFYLPSQVLIALRAARNVSAKG
ncbi:MAG: hypothetical protein J6A88_03610 [Oscillospiraceae bacterium]|nr:hypothetical protein [Oscillospiraceae bacterium]